ncbi:alpha/beta-hydrolase [Thozetella sp. PMI_491]|nr:alpha/beta-hydrolase [Thozetella sp. PMI_491]
MAGAYVVQCVTTKQFTTSAGNTYVYNYAAAQDSKPTFLLLHGYPSSRHDWRYQIANLSDAGFGVLAPDCLGYGDSDKPTALEAYNLKRIAGDMVEILDNEGLDKVVGVGHDWGTSILSRTHVWHPERFSKLAFLSIGYSPSGVFLDVDALNAFGLATLGYMQFGYWYFFNSWDSASVISSHLESYFHLAFPTNASSWAADLAGLGSARAWLNANTTTALPTWLSEEDKAAWLRTYSQKDAVAASINYYQSIMRGVQIADEASLTDADRMIHVPVLAIGGAKDLVTRADQLSGQMEPWVLGGYTEKVVDAGHWLMLEQHEEVTAILAEFASSA